MANFLENEVPEDYFKKFFKVAPIAFKFIKMEPTLEPNVFTSDVTYFKHRVNLN
jgi:hypothetical protein